LFELIVFKERLKGINKKQEGKKENRREKRNGIIGK